MQQSKPPDQIIDIDEYRYVSSEERPEVLLEEELPAAPAPPYVWIRQTESSGGCCCSLSTAALLAIGIFLLGLVALGWLLWSILDWALPF